MLMFIYILVFQRLLLFAQAFQEISHLLNLKFQNNHNAGSIHQICPLIWMLSMLIRLLVCVVSAAIPTTYYASLHHFTCFHNMIIADDMSFLIVMNVTLIIIHKAFLNLDNFLTSNVILQLWNIVRPVWLYTTVYNAYQNIQECKFTINITQSLL